MNRKYALNGCLVLLFCLVFYKPVVSQTADMPHLHKQGSATQLMVNNRPLLMLAGELGNSSASNTEYMLPVWNTLVKAHVNTVLIPLYWELVEPEEGKADFTLVDSMIYNARKNNLKIVFLWFGSWKNSMSCYAPMWVKTNQERFPRARLQNGTAIEILTPFSSNNCDADIKIFAGLLKHIKAVDAKDQTVVMVQVENEIGMIPEARDHCDQANRAFSDSVPGELMNYLMKNKSLLAPKLTQIWLANGFKKEGSWEEVFGKGLQTDELFMAWYFAKYANSVAQAGKAAYPLPMYVNAALIRKGYKPGAYPSAGPLPHLINIWKAAAPAIDFISPDIYFPEFKTWVDRYCLPANPLFIPEVGNTQSMTQAFYAFGGCNAMGYSPFAIESVTGLNDNDVTKAYDVLDQLSPIILKNQGLGTMSGFLLDSIYDATDIRLGGYIFHVKHENSWVYGVKCSDGIIPRVGGLIIMTGSEEFIVAGSGIIVTFEPVSNDQAKAGIGSIDEGKFVKGIWIAGRRLNGDQSHQGRHLYLPGNEFGIQRVVLYTYR